MPSSRVLAAGLVATLSLAFAALLTRAIFEGMAVGVIDPATLSMLFVVGFLIVATVIVIAAQGRIVALAASHCPTCGSLLYATVRSLDRRRLLTCFSCGHETVAA